MSNTKKCHYISQFLLRNFKDEKGKLYAFEKSTRNITTHLSPKYILQMNSLYPQHIEDELQKIESQFSWHLKSLIEKNRNEKTFQLSEQQKKLLIKFILVQHARHPDRIEEIINKFDRRYFEESMLTIERNTGLSFPPEIKSLFLDSEARKPIVLENTFSHLIQDTLDQGPKNMLDPLADTLNSGNFGILTPEKMRNSFVIGDKGITIWPDRNYPLHHPSVRLIFPVSYDTTIVWGLQSVENHTVYSLPCEEVRKFNRFILKQSDMIVGRSARLLNSLARIYKWKEIKLSDG